METPTHDPARPRDAARTRDAILHAAQRLFASQGYTTTGVREIAAAAGVNSTLVRRYFGSKDGLLRACLEELLQVEAIVAGDRAGFGARAAAALLRAGTDGMAEPVAIMMLAMADAKARRLCGALVQENVLQPLADWMGGADALDRAAQLNILWTGFIAQRRLTPLRQLDDANVAPTIAWLERATQAIADGAER
ncbi:MAG: TetR/AcrR family transcriptional regulator [Sphingomonadales bacterium]|nr:MAG: TetR/AcrR family transcriptional regulator [Sphingomonadales bacterium]